MRTPIELSRLIRSSSDMVNVIEEAQTDAYDEAVSDIIKEIDKQISCFTHDYRESISDSVMMTCSGAIFGLNRLKESLFHKGKSQIWKNMAEGGTKPKNYDELRKKYSF